MPLVHQLALPLLQLSSQPPQLALILAQQGALVHILVHPCSIADVLGPIGELERAQGLCSTGQAASCAAVAELPLSGLSHGSRCRVAVVHSLCILAGLHMHLALFADFTGHLGSAA